MTSEPKSGRLAGKRIVFIGGVTNIGAAAVRACVAEGGRVFIGDLNATAGAAIAAELGAAVQFRRLDVTEEADVAAFMTAAAGWLGGIDPLCQNAGYLRAGRIEDFPADEWDRIYAVNIRAQFLGAKYAVPHLKAAGKGSIVNMSSTAGKRGGAGRTAYSSSKGAVIAFGVSLAAELAPFNIRVNTLCPGWIDTEFNRPAIDYIEETMELEALVQSGVPLGRQGTPEEVAPMFVYLISDESSYVTSQSLVIDGGGYNS